jgi:hypothetical protein
MPIPGWLLSFLFAALLTAPAAAAAAQGVDELDVTIRMIDRLNPEIDDFINRIELPARMPAGIVERDDAEDARRDTPGPHDSGHARDSMRERIETKHSGNAAEDRLPEAADIFDSTHEARERGREALEAARQLRHEARDDMRDGARPFRND